VERFLLCFFSGASVIDQKISPAINSDLFLRASQSASKSEAFRLGWPTFYRDD
jgi:hypothetical protein